MTSRGDSSSGEYGWTGPMTDVECPPCDSANQRVSAAGPAAARRWDTAEPVTHITTSPHLIHNFLKFIGN